MFEIPFKDLADWETTLDLDSELYVFRFTWNDRLNYWSFSISDPELNPIILGLKITVNNELITPYNYNQQVPPGELWCVNHNANNTRIEKDDFLNSVAHLVYIPVDEV